MAYTKEEDMALLRLRSIDKIEHVTKFYPLDRIKEIKMFMKTYAVGAALGHQPIATDGWITCMSDEQDNFVFWMSTAQIIFGNSGGSMYIEAAAQVNEPALTAARSPGPGLAPRKYFRTKC